MSLGRGSVRTVQHGSLQAGCHRVLFACVAGRRVRWLVRSRSSGCRVVCARAGTATVACPWAHRPPWRGHDGHRGGSAASASSPYRSTIAEARSMDCVAQQRAVTMCRESFRNAVRRGSVRSFDLLPSSLNQPKQTHACRMYDVIISHPHLLLPLLPLHYECAAPPSNAVLVFARHAEFARPRVIGRSALS
mgnify:CR=1 FL=1